MQPLHLSFIFTFLFLASLVSGQTLDKNTWALSAGWTESFIGNQHMSPLLYHGDVLTLGGRYMHARQGKKFIEVGLQLEIGTIQAQRHRKRRGTFNETPSLFTEQESYEFKVNPFLSKGSGRLFARFLWPVGQYGQLGFKTELRYDLAGMAGDTWQYAQATLGPSYQYQRPLHARGDLYFSAHLPLAAVVVRPNWAIDASLPDETNYFKGYLRTNTRFASINTLQHPQIRMGYLYELKNDKSISVDYNLSWLSHPDPRPLRMLEHGIRLNYFL